jgi:hypothetical protein
MIQQTQFPFQQHIQQQVSGKSKSPYLAIIFTAIFAFALLSILYKFNNKKEKQLSG